MFNSTKKTSQDGVTVLRRNGVLLSHFERNRDVIPPHPAAPQALGTYKLFWAVSHNMMRASVGPIIKEIQ
jgi:hypothetical protein